MRNKLMPILYAFLFYAYILPLRTHLSYTYSVPKIWKKIGVSDPNHQLEFTIMLPQKNLDILESSLIKISNPNSYHYGKWLNKNAVDSIVYASKSNFT